MLEGLRPHLNAWVETERLERPVSPMAPIPLTGAEVLLGKFHQVLDSAAEPLGLATMAVGSLAFGLGRWATVRGITQWAPRFWRAKPLSGHFIGSVGGLGLESSAFSTFPRVYDSLSGNKVDWDPHSLIHDFSKTGLLLGMLRVSGFGGNLFLKNPAAKVFGWGAAAAVPPLAMGLGIYGNLYLEEKLGWRSDLGWQRRLGDSLSTFIQFQAAGSAVHHLLGSRYLEIQQHLQRKAQDIQKSWLDSLPHWNLGLGLNGATAGVAPMTSRRHGPRDLNTWLNQGSEDGSGRIDGKESSIPSSGERRDDSSEQVRSSKSSEPPPLETIEFQLQPKMELANGRYTVLDLIGRGGMAEVWKLQDNELDRFVATKIGLPEYRRELQSRYETEYRLQVHLPREWRVEIYEIIEVTKGLKVPIIEYVPGKSLDHLVAWLNRSYEMADEHYPIEKRIGIFSDVCEAVVGTHGVGILHRDLKPGNIMLTTGDYIRVMDYGVAKEMEGGRDLPQTSSHLAATFKSLKGSQTQIGNFVGTHGYAPPEVISPKDNAENFKPEQRDVFSLGVILYEMVTGHHPLGEYQKNPHGSEPALIPIRNAQDVTEMSPHRALDLLYGPPPSFTEFHAFMDGPLYRRLEEVAFRAMSADSRVRYKNAQELRLAVLMVDPEVRFERLKELREEIRSVENELKQVEPSFRRSRRKSSEEGLRVTQLEQRARNLMKTAEEENNRLINDLSKFAHREDFPAAQHMIARLSAYELMERGSRIHPERHATLMEQIRENDVAYGDYTKPVMARALKEGVAVDLRVHPIHEPLKRIDGLRWRIIRLEAEKDSDGYETGNFIKARSISLDPQGARPALEYGSYVFELEAPEYKTMRVPVRLTYGMIKNALSNGKPLTLEMEMVPARLVPPDMEVIHRARGYIGHNFYLDGDIASANSFPLQSIEIPTQGVSRDKISVRQYFAFIEDLLLENQRTHQFNGKAFRARLEEIEALLPRTTVSPEARGKQRKFTGRIKQAFGAEDSTFYWRLVKERYLWGVGPTVQVRLLDPTLHEDPFGEPIHWDHPISATPPEGGFAYVAWRARKESKPYEMLDADTKEVISRNGSEDRYPWGNGDMNDSYLVTRGSFEDVSRATPQIIGTHPMGMENYRDVSLHGIRELLGNVREITSTPGEPDHFCLSGGCVRMYLGANFNPSARYQNHRKAAVDSDGTFRLKLPFPKEE